MISFFNDSKDRNWVTLYFDFDTDEFEKLLRTEEEHFWELAGQKNALMITVGFAPKFVRKYHTLEPILKTEVKEKLALLTSRSNHQQLKVHKLQGKLANRQAFWVNYKIRVVFKFVNKQNIICLSIGDHDVYK